MLVVECFPALTFMPAKISKPLSARLARVKLFLCDVDGVLTDGMVLIGGGVESKRFNIRDGLGLKMLQGQGIQVGWVSRRPSKATKQRAEDLKLDFLVQSESSKVRGVENILQEAGLNWPQLCYVGDDVVDAGVLKRAGVGVAVANGVSEARAAADYVTKVGGGEGAVREVVELVLKAQGRWEQIVAEYSA